MKKADWEAQRLAQAEKLHTVWDEQPDWWAQCRHCGQLVRGTPKALRAHKCEDHNGTAR